MLLAIYHPDNNEKDVKTPFCWAAVPNWCSSFLNWASPSSQLKPSIHPWPGPWVLATSTSKHSTVEAGGWVGWVSIFDHDEVWRRRGPEWWESGVERGVIGATDQPSRHTAEIDDQGKDQNLKISQIQRRSRFTQNKVMPRPSQISRIRFPNRVKALDDGF